MQLDLLQHALTSEGLLIEQFLMHTGVESDLFHQEIKAYYMSYKSVREIIWQRTKIAREKYSLQED